jgi:hypothetical protein
MEPSGATLRIRQLLSLMKTEPAIAEPASATATLTGKYSIAEVAGPPSPLSPAAPKPAYVEM